MVRYFALVSVKCPFKSDDCEQCKERQVFKSMRTVQESRRLVEIYKALSSPSYILYAASEDPLLEAFTLCQEMVVLSVEDAPFKVSICMYTCTCTG